MTQRATETLKHDVFPVADIHAKRFWLKPTGIESLCTCRPSLHTRLTIALRGYSCGVVAV